MSMLCKQHKGFLINVHVNLHVCQNYKELQSYLLNLVSIYSTASLSLNQSSLNVMESEEAEREEEDDLEELFGVVVVLDWLL